MENAAAREHATRQWTAHPCGAVDGDELSRVLHRGRAEPLRPPTLAEEGHRVRSVSRSEGPRDRSGAGHRSRPVRQSRRNLLRHRLTERHLEAAARNFEARGLPVVLKKCDATQIDFGDGYFDLVYSFGVIHHIPDASKVVQEIRRVLKPGGKCLVTLYHHTRSSTSSCSSSVACCSGSCSGWAMTGSWRRSKRERTGWRSSPTSSCTRREARALLSGFQIDRISIHQLDLGRFGPSWPGRLMTPVLRRLEPLIGWYVVLEATR